MLRYVTLKTPLGAHCWSILTLSTYTALTEWRHALDDHHSILRRRSRQQGLLGSTQVPASRVQQYRLLPALQGAMRARVATHR